jgi:hypothetical protein
MVALLLLVPRMAEACACLASGPACEAVWQADAVFDGTVTTVTPSKGSREVAGRPVVVDEKKVRLTVSQSWRGSAAGSVEVVTSASAAECGVDFTPGTRYLVFAHRRPGGQLATSMCSLTAPFDGRGETADYLASLSKPAAGGRLFGTVRLVQRVGSTTRIRKLDPSLIFKVRVSGDRPATEARVVDGRFSLTSLPPGRYQAELIAPRGFVARAPARTFVIADPHACVQQDFSVAPQRR